MHSQCSASHFNRRKIRIPKVQLSKFWSPPPFFAVLFHKFLRRSTISSLEQHIIRSSRKFSRFSMTCSGLSSGARSITACHCTLKFYRASLKTLVQFAISCTLTVKKIPSPRISTGAVNTAKRLPFAKAFVREKVYESNGNGCQTGILNISKSPMNCHCP